MRISSSRCLALIFVVGIVTILSACVLSDGGYGYGDGGIGAGYYEPYGAEYGGWGSDYQVAPFRDGGHRGGFSHASYAHAYRSAPASHSMPSLPSRSEGGARSGGSSRSGNSRFR